MEYFVGVLVELVTDTKLAFPVVQIKIRRSHLPVISLLLVLLTAVLAHANKPLF